MRSKSALFLTALLSVVFGVRVADAECSGQQSAGEPSAAGDPVYAVGEPKSIQVDDGGVIKQLDYIKVGHRAIFEGDILIGDADQLEFAAQPGPVKLFRQNDPVNGMTPFGYVAKAVISGARKWPANTIPYVIDPALVSSDLIISAMNKWEEVTKLKFVERTVANASSYKNYVYFTVGTDPNACLSDSVGIRGGRQNVELVSGCGLGQIIHEIGHVAGLDHEQNRSDRDKFVRVKTENISKGYVSQFAQRPSVYKDFETYDFDSIMHYVQDAFSCNHKPTIVPVVNIPEGVRIGQRDHISSGDANVVNSIYK